MSDDRVMMLNPNTGREDRTIAAAMYEPVRAAVLTAVGNEDGLGFADLSDRVEALTDPALWESASVGWYTTTVKLDLEARGLLMRAGSPQKLHLTNEGRAALEAC